MVAESGYKVKSVLPFVRLNSSIDSTLFAFLRFSVYPDLPVKNDLNPDWIESNGIASP